MMKRFFTCIVLVFCLSVSMFGQDSFFKKFADRDDITSVYISKAMLRMMPDVQAEGVDIGNVASKLNSIQILSCEKPELIPQIRKEMAYINPRNGYEELMRVNDAGERVLIYMKEEGKQSHEYVLLCEEKNEYTVIVLEGNLTLTDIQGIVKK